MAKFTRHSGDDGGYKRTSGGVLDPSHHTGTGIDPDHKSALDDATKKTKDASDKIRDTSMKASDKGEAFKDNDESNKNKFNSLNTGANTPQQPTATAPQQSAPQQSAPQQPTSTAPQQSAPQQPQTPSISSDALKDLISHIDKDKLNSTAPTGAVEGNISHGKSVKAPINKSLIRYLKDSDNKILSPGEREDTIRTAAQMVGIPDENVDEWVHTFMFLQEHESSGNINALNETDSNARGAEVEDGGLDQESRGINQVIPPTFANYHLNGTSYNIYDPVANTAASLLYVMDRYNVPPDGGQALADFDAARHVNGYTGY